MFGRLSNDDPAMAQLSASISSDQDLRAATEAEVDWADDDEKKPAGSKEDHADAPQSVATAASCRDKVSSVVPSSTYYGQTDTKAGSTEAVSLPWTAQTASKASSALIKYASGSTLLPQQIAEVVSNLSLLARVSLKSAAFFIELVLEAAKYGTGLGLGITRRALISAVGTARALHSIGSGEEWDARAAGRSSTIADSVKHANDAFLSLLDKYTAVGIYLIHHTFTMAELFAMSSFYIAGSSLQAGLAAADESVRMIDGIFGSNETSRALASFITLVKGEFGGDPRFADRGRLGMLATLTKAITAFAVLQNSTYKRSAKSMKMRVLYDCTVLGEVETKSWRSMIVGSGNFVKTQGPPEPHLLPPPEAVRSPSLFDERLSPSARYLDLPFQEDDRMGASNRYSMGSAPSSATLPSSRTRQRLGDGLCLTDISGSGGYGDHGWMSNGMPSPSTADSTRPGSVCGDDASIMADLDFLVGADGDDDGAHFVRASGNHSSDDRYHVDSLASPTGAHGPEMRRYIRRHPGTARNETVYEVTTETIETTETVTTTEERRRPPEGGRSSRPAKQALSSREARTGLDGATSLIEKDITTSRSGMGTESFFQGGRETTYEEEDEWCEIARTTNGAAMSRSDSVDTVTADSSRRLAGSDAMGVDPNSGLSLTGDDLLPEAPNGRAVVVRGEKGDKGLDASGKVQVVLKTMTKKLIQKRRTIRKFELRSDAEEDDVTMTGASARASLEDVHRMDEDGDDRANWRQSAGVSMRGPKTPLASPRADKRSSTRPQPTRRASPPAAAKTTRAHSKQAEMSTGFSKVLKIARNSLKNPGGTGTSRSHSSDRHADPASKRAEPSSAGLFGPTGAAQDTARKALPSRPGDDEQSNHLEAKASLFKGNGVLTSRSKRTASPTEPTDLKAHKQAGNLSPKKALARSAGKDLPRIPARTESKPTIAAPSDHYSARVKDHDGPSLPLPGAPMGSMRDKRRSRAPSITSLRSFASRTHKQSTARGPAPGSSETESAGAFPRAHLVFNLYKFMRHSSAAYGQNFMRILGIGSLDYFFPDTTKHHANVWAFAHHVGIPVDSILLNSFSEPQSLSSEQMSPLVNYVAVDDQAQAVVLTCRGTLGLSDILTDLTCTYEDIAVPGGVADEVYQVHTGMLASAKRLSSPRSTVMQTICNALDSHPDYGLVITGHSLGGGVAALLAILLGCKAEYFQEQVLLRRQTMGHIRHPKIFTPFVTAFDSGLPVGRPIHAYAYGPPAVASPDLSRYCRGLVTSVVHGHDFVPTLSLGAVRDMKNIAQALCSDADGDTAKEIVGKVIGLYQARRKNAKATLSGPPPAGLLEDSVHPPTEPPAHERELIMEPEELEQGRSRNRAHDSGYQDPRLAEEEADTPFSFSEGGGLNPGAGSKHHSHANPNHAGTGDPERDRDADLQDWLWSLIKTVRADMCEEKLYPPGEVYCIESFPVFVTPRMQPSSRTGTSNGFPHQSTPPSSGSENGSGSSAQEGRAEAHRVILRHCEDVEKRFSEPIFAKSMLRDHIPTNYELCMSLLFESIVPRATSE